MRKVVFAAVVLVACGTAPGGYSNGVFLEREYGSWERVTWVSKFFAGEHQFARLKQPFGVIKLVSLDPKERRHPAFGAGTDMEYVSDTELNSTGLICAARIFFDPEPKLYVARKVPASQPTPMSGLLVHGRYSRISLEAAVGLDCLRNAHLREHVAAESDEAQPEEP